MPVPSAQVKSAILLAGLLPKEKPQLSRKRKRAITPSECCVTSLFARRGMKTAPSRFLAIRFQSRATSEFPVISPRATYWLTAAAAQPGGHLLVRELGLNTTRTPVLGVLVRMGAQVREAIEDVDQLEPRGIVEITGAMLKGTVIQGKKLRN